MSSSRFASVLMSVVAVASVITIGVGVFAALTPLTSVA